MDFADVLWRLDEERRGLVRDGEVVETLADVTRIRAADGTHHGVIWSGLTDASADAAIERELRHHRGLNAGFEWKVYAHDRPANLKERLARRGFTVGPGEAVVVCDLADLGAWVEEGDAAPGHVVRRVETAAQLADFRRVAEAAFGKDYTFTTTQLAAEIAAASTDHRGYVAYAGDEPVSIGRLYTHRHSAFGGLYGGGTVAAFRGRGFYRAVVAARARDARASGARYLVVDALPTSRPILERLGFERVTETWPCEWAPPE